MIDIDRSNPNPNPNPNHIDTNNNNTMTKKNECRVVSNAIKAVVPGFQHKCNTSRHNALRVLGSRIDECCTAMNGTRTTTTLIPDQLYPICYRMNQVIINTNNNRDPPRLWCCGRSSRCWGHNSRRSPRWCCRQDYVATDRKYKTRNILGSSRNSSSRNCIGE